MSQCSTKMFKLVSVCVFVLALAGVIFADDDAITSAPAEGGSKEEVTSTTAAPSTSSAPAPEQSTPIAAPPELLEARALFDNLGKEFAEPAPVECKIDNVVLKSGEKHAYSGECTELTCHPDGMITGITCPFVIAPPGCQINPQDLSKAYPQCCETWTC